VLRELRTLVCDTYLDTSDGELLERYLGRREERAFVALLKRHGPMVLRVCQRVGGNAHDAEDAFQATFLLLARKADSIRKHESVACWLHGVAQRLALEARGREIRRQARERMAADMRKSSATSPTAWQELQATLDKVLQQVPPRYRAPIILCYLEGKTQEEAARLLDCPLGTVRSRLARGRARLKGLLEREGVHLSVAPLALTLPAVVTPVALPPRLLESTAMAALAYAAGKGTGFISAGAAALVTHGLKTLAAAKLKIAMLLAIVLGALSLGVGTLVHRVLAAAPLAAPAAAEAPAEASKKVPATSRPEPAPANAHKTTIRGRVLSPEGYPQAGASLLLVGKGDERRTLGTTASDGRFAVVVPEERKEQFLIARSEGAGIDFLYLDTLNPAKEVALQLVPDRVICGQIRDTQGRPVAGAELLVRQVAVYPGNSLDSFLAEWKKRHFMSGLPGGVKHLWRETDAFFATTTGPDGRFVMAGLGDERLVCLRVRKDGISDAELWVANRAGFDPRPYNEAMLNNIPKGFDRSGFNPLLYGPDLSFVAEAEKPIHGTVTDRDTGKPRAGVQVRLSREGNELLPLFLSAKTGSDGRYEIRGSRKLRSYMVEIAPDPVAGLLACQARANDTPGYAPITLDLRVARGVVVTGKVIDKATGKPVPGFAVAGILSDNSLVKDYPEFGSSASMQMENTAADGSFRLVTIPGPVLLMGGPDSNRLPGGMLEHMEFKPPVRDPAYPQYFPKYPDTYSTTGGAMSVIQGNFCKVLQIKPGTTVVHQDVVLERLPAVPVQIQDTDGRPLKGTWVTGISPRDWNRPLQIENDTCSVFGLEPGKPRLLVFCEENRRLVGTLRLEGSEKGPLFAKLGPLGAAKGRLRAPDGKPLAGYVVEVSYPERVASEIHDHIHRAKQVMTDTEGSFQFGQLIPGLAFKLYHHRGKPRYDGSGLISDKAVQVSPGQMLDLGELTPKPSKPESGE
jgi:RNA polymerase sigma factor (sigma-70 family)